MKRRGNILIENVIFIILNVAFLSILILFVFSRAGNEAVLEERYAKQIALMIDYSSPGMRIVFPMLDAVEKAEKNFLDRDINKIVSIHENIVSVKLRDRGGYSYSFFNDVEVSGYFLENGYYNLLIDKKDKNMVETSFEETLEDENIEGVLDE